MKAKFNFLIFNFKLMRKFARRINVNKINMLKNK